MYKPEICNNFIIVMIKTLLSLASYVRNRSTHFGRREREETDEERERSNREVISMT